METSIRFVRIDRRSVKPALCFRGRKKAYVVINDDAAVRVVSNIPVDLIDKAPLVMGPAGLGTRVYPIELYAQHMEKIGARKGMTMRAKFMLEKACNGGLTDDAVLPPDELLGGTAPPAPSSGSESGRQVPPNRVGPPQSVPRTGPATVPRPAPQSARKAPITRPPGASGAPRTAGADIIRAIAAELKLEPTKLRKLLRSKGLSAPYTDEKLIRSKLG